ncbi:MAG: hypothetical protein WHT27_06060 [candidate division WOR-3 bacterium]
MENLKIFFKFILTMIGLLFLMIIIVRFLLFVFDPSFGIFGIIVGFIFLGIVYKIFNP